MRNLHDIRPATPEFYGGNRFDVAWMQNLDEAGVRELYERLTRQDRHTPIFPAREEIVFVGQPYGWGDPLMQRVPRTETIIPRLHRRLAELRYALHGRLDGIGLVVTRAEYDAFLREIEGTYYSQAINLGTFEGVPLIVR